MPRDDDPETQFETLSSGTDNDLWEVVRILAENPEKRLYLLLWKGEDPETKYEYEPTWEPKEGCTQDLIVEWKERVRADPTIRHARHGEKILREWRAGFEEEMARRKAAKRAERKGKGGKKRKSRGDGDGQGAEKGVDEDGGQDEQRESKRGRKGVAREASATSHASKTTTADPAAVAGQTRGARSHSEATTAAASTSAPRKSRVSIELPSGTHHHGSSARATASGSGTNGAGNAHDARRPLSRAGPSNASARAASPADAEPESFEEATQVDPRSLDDETYRPPAAPSPRKRVTRGADKAKPTRKTRMGPVPQPDLADFRAPMTRGKGRTATQVTRSTQEDIQQFSSPPEGEDGDQEGAEVGAEDDADVEAEAVTRPVDDGVGEGVEESMARPLVKRIVDGEEVWEAASNEEAPGDLEDVDETAEMEPIPEHEVEVAVSGQGRGGTVPDVVPESIPAVAPEPTSMADQGVQAEAGTEAEPEQVDQSVQAATPDAVEKAVSTDASPAQVDAATTMTGIISGVSAAVQTAVEAVAPVADAIALPTDVVELQARVAALATSLEDAAERNTALTEETTFLREHYQTASSRAASEARRVMELEEELARRKKQLVTALKQKDLHYKAVLDQNQLEETQLRGQVKILLDQARLTDDAIRHKAVMYPRVKKENDSLRIDNAELESRVGKLVKRNEDLMDQLEVLRARQLGVIGGDDDASRSESGLGSESESEADFTDGDSEMDMELSAQGRVGGDAVSGSSRGESSRGGMRAEELRALGYAPRLQTSSMASIPPSAEVQDVGEMAVEVVEVEALEPDVDALALGFETSEPGLGYECAWRVGEEEVLCGLLAETQDVLLEHYASHRSDIVPLHL